MGGKRREDVVRDTEKGWLAFALERGVRSLWWWVLQET